MAELYVDMEGLFEAECGRAIQRLADSEQYQADLHKLQRKIKF